MEAEDRRGAQSKTEPDGQCKQEPELDLGGPKTQWSERQQEGILHQPKGVGCQHMIFQAKVRAEACETGFTWLSAKPAPSFLH